MDFAKILAKIDSIESKTQLNESGAKPDFLDLDKDGDRKEPMKSAAKTAKAGKGHDKDDDKLDEAAAPGQEDWIKSNKEKFIKQYGKKKGMEVLYATAWKRSKKKDESAQLEECYGQAMSYDSGMADDRSGMSISSSMDTRTGNKTLTVSAEGEAAENLAQILKLSGLASGNYTTGEVAEEYANEPKPVVQGMEVQLQQGNDLNRPKKMTPHGYRNGDNPLAMDVSEQAALASIEHSLMEELDAIKASPVDRSKIPAAKRKAAGGDWKTTTQDLEREKERNISGPEGLAALKRKTGITENSSSLDFDKVLQAIAALYGPDIWDNDAMQDLANDLEQAGPTEQELDFIIAKGRLPNRLANTKFSRGDGVQFNEGSKNKKIPASNKPVDPKDALVSLKDVPVKKPRGHTQYDPAKEFPGIKVFKKQDVAEGSDIRYHPTSGTKATYTVSSKKLSNKPQASKSDVTLKSGSMHHRGNSYNFPKGTLFTQLPGGIFAKHPSVPETHPGYGHLIRSSEDNINKIHGALNDGQDVMEEKKTTKSGTVHKAKPGRYGGYDPETDPDKDEDDKKSEPAVKRGRGRPKKGSDSDTGEVKKWDTSALQSAFGSSAPKKLPGKASVKHKMKDDDKEDMAESKKRYAMMSKKKDDVGESSQSWQDEFADMIGQMKKSGRLGMPKSNYNYKTPEPKSKEELMSRLKELEAEFDPAYQQSDDYSFWKKQNDIASEISSIRRQLQQQGVAEAKSPQEFMTQISKSDSSILNNKKESPYYAAGKMLSKYADKIGQDSMDFADFKQHAALLMGGPEANMKSAKQVRNLDTAASDIILDMIWEYSSTQKDADTYFKISGFKRLREGTQSTTADVAEGFNENSNMPMANDSISPIHGGAKKSAVKNKKTSVNTK
jgi:hypothetical protein